MASGRRGTADLAGPSPGHPAADLVGSATRSLHQLQLDPDRNEEDALRRRGFRFVAGIDEVGRGALAGPVVAAAVVLPVGWVSRGLRESKLLRPHERERLADEIRRVAVAWAIAAVEPALIDRLNILRATELATLVAAGRLAVRPDALILDGTLAFPDLPLAQRALVDADRRCLSVAAASILAKVERDRIMVELDVRYPGYGLANNKGYAAPDHLAALQRLGPSPIHRRSFAPCGASPVEVDDQTAAI
jgi:ribonuclease HII